MTPEEVSTSTDPIVLPSVSVSQLNAYGRCPRRWFLGKVRKVPAPKKPSASTGIEIHRIIEGWFKRGVIQGATEHLEKCHAAVAQLPAPHPRLLVEHHFSIPPEDGLPKFTGVIDLVVPPAPPLQESIDIIDHKSSSSVEKIRVNPVSLITDPQMLVYAEWGYRTYGDTRPVRVTHNTISTKHKARVLPLRWVEIPRKTAADNWENQKITIRGMLGLAESPVADFNDVPCNPEACGDYGGCDYLPLCSVKNQSLGVKKMAYDESAASDLLARLNKLTAGIVKDLPEAPPALEEAAAVPPDEPPVALLPPDAAPRDPMPTVVETALIAEPSEPGATPKAKRGRPAKEKPTAVTTAATTFEYAIDDNNDLLALNTRGALGWELVSIGNGQAVYKRQVTP